MSSETKEKLTKAALEQIEEVGLAQVTVRGIAARAEANVATVNYHFGSKARLVEVALTSSLVELRTDLDAMTRSFPPDPRARLVELFCYLLEGSFRYPNVTRAHLHDMFTSQEKSGPVAEAFAAALPPIATAIHGAVPGLTPETAMHRAVASMSATLLPAFFPGLFVPARNWDSAEVRADYIHEVVAAALGG
ncbi:MAG: TetR/AcrR family transcriptional regulator [Myxococcota bacterium]